MTAVNLVALPRVVPTHGRIHIAVAPGTTVAAMVAMAMPEFLGRREKLRVTIGDHVVAGDLWDKVRPLPGVTVIMRPILEGATLRTVLQVVVAVAAIAAGQYYAAAGLPLLFGSTAITSAVVTTAVLVAGSLLVNALIPVRQSSDEAKQSPTIQGFRNALNPNGVIPEVLGTHRFAPPYAATPYTEIVGDDQYVVAAFLFGFGKKEISNLRLGDTPIAEFEDVVYEVREGEPDDGPLLIYPQQVLEEQLNARLNGGTGGTVLPGSQPGEVDPTPVVRVCALDASEVSVDLAFPQGLVEYSGAGDRKNLSVDIRIRQRVLGSSTWETVTTLTITSNQQKLLRRTYRWELPVRGPRYEIEVTRMTSDRDDPKKGQQDKCDWTVLRSFRPEYPINYGVPLALASVRIKATEQLNGIVDNFNADVSVVCKDWDANTSTWIERATSNPASLLRYAWQGPSNAYPKTDDELDLVALADWHEFCDDKGLTYNRVHDFDAKLEDVLADIAAAGRATPHDTGDKWSVVVDRVSETVVGHISPRNSWGFEGETVYATFPDAFRVQFFDENNGYAQAERVVPWPGFVGTPEITEEISLPGITDPDLIWKEARRRQYELIYRPHTYTVQQDVEQLVLQRGDLAMLSHDVLDRTQKSARVKAVSGLVVTLDETVTMEFGLTYAARFRRADGTTLRLGVTEFVGDTNTIRVLSTPTSVAAGDLVLFGESVRGEAFPVIVKGIESGENLTARLTLVDQASNIEDLVDAETPGTWNGRIGAALAPEETTPPAPVIYAIISGDLAIPNNPDDDGYSAVILVRPGSGAVLPRSYEIEYRRPFVTSTWTVATVSAAEAAARIAEGVYSLGDVIDVRARAISIGGVASAYTSTIEHTIGEDNLSTPAIDSFTPTRLDEGSWQYAWVVESGEGIAAAAGVLIRYGAGELSDWDDLDPMNSGSLLTLSPWLVGVPATDGEWTFGIRAVTDDGTEGAVTFVTVNLP